ncbi:MAG: hypothetical protein HY649_11285 [Acidobacteria bacterium]|nr:hypothetical protein [Acidobacteriota bacterium]
MFNYQAGQKVKNGLYLNLSKWEIVPVERGGGTLPEGEGHRYVKLPLLLMLLFAPVMGLLYVVFLPFIGFALLLSLMARKSLRALRKVVLEMRQLVSSALRP